MENLEYMKLLHLRETLEEDRTMLNTALEGIEEYSSLLNEFQHVRNALKKAKKWVYLDFVWVLTEVKYIHIEEAEFVLKDIIRLAKNFNEKNKLKDIVIRFDGKCHIDETIVELDHVTNFWMNGIAEQHINEKIMSSLEIFESNIDELESDFVNIVKRFDEMVETLNRKIQTEEEILKQMEREYN